MKDRIQEIDYLKSIFITLMVMFHLVYFGDYYPYMKRIVYTFHMSAFLIISGYVVNTQKDKKTFTNELLWIFIPYSIMEIGYATMASILPIREHINQITPLILINKIFIHPIGPYWYLQTIIICDFAYYFLYKIIRSQKEIVYIILLSLILFFLSSPPVHILSFANAMYFILGVVIKRSNIPFIKFFQSTWLSIIPLILLCCHPSNLNRALLPGMIITYLTITFSLSVYKYQPSWLRHTTSYIGRNTLPILLFSPIFTILSKTFIPLLKFDPTHMVFMLISVTFSIIGSLSIALIMDKLYISKCFFGKANILK